MLKLIADIFAFILKAPFKAMSWLNVAVQQRAITTKASEAAGKEVKQYKKVWAFFRFVFLMLLWLVLLTIFVGIIWGLWWVNAALGMERLLGGPWPALRPYWLPILFVMICVASFVGYRLYLSLGPERDAIEFSDIDEAWLEARAALVDAGIDLTKAPIFLVLGRPASNPHALMTAARMPFDVQQIPLKSNPAMQVYASKQAIYVLALDACLISRQAQLLSEAVEARPTEEMDKERNMVFDEPAPPPPAEGTETPAPPPPPDPLLASQNLLAESSVGLLTAPAPEPESPWAALRMPSLLKKTEDVDLYRRRLRYLTRRIVNDREPYCPLNGVLLLVPFMPLDKEEDASQIATLCEMDLQTLRTHARTRCPLVVLVSDLEAAPGYGALNDRLDADRRVRLFGQDLPLVPDVKPEDVPGMLSSSLGHFVRTLGQWGFRLYRVEESPRDDAASLSAANTQLFELLESIRVREPSLERLLTRICTSDPPLEFLLGGVYLAATGTHPDKDQAFVPGIFQQFVQNQNAVAWTDEALSDESDYQRWTTYGYAALGIFVISVIVLLYLRWQTMNW